MTMQQASTSSQAINRMYLKITVMALGDTSADLLQPISCSLCALCFLAS